MSLADAGGRWDRPVGTARSSGRRLAGRAGLAVPWTFGQTLVGVLLTVVPWVLLAVVTQALAAPAPHRPITPAQDKANAIVVGVASAIIEALFLIAPLYYAIRTRRRGGPGALNSLGFRGFSLGTAAFAFLGCIVALLVFYQVYGQAIVPYLQSHLVPYLQSHFHITITLQTNTQAIQQQAKSAPYSTAALLIVGATVAPLAEETFFRGYTLPGFARAMPAWLAILFSSLVFGIAHADLGSLIPLVFIGILLAVLRTTTGSTWPGILFHALNNAVAALAVFSIIQTGM
jgi:membrane protease YdiL (CAAX protease family)